MALSFDVTGVNSDGSSGTATSISKTLTFDGSDIIIVDVISAATTSHATVTSVTSALGSLTFVNRFEYYLDNVFGIASGSANAFLTLSRWWAYAGGSALSSDLITANFSKGINGSILVTGVTGFTGTAYQTNPFDTNVSLPANATSTSAAVPGVTGVSTDSATALVYGLAVSADNTTVTVGTGYTNIANTSDSGVFTTPISGHNSALLNQYQVLSSPLSSATVGFNSGSVHGWIFVADALAQPVSSNTITFLPLLGAGG